MKSQLNSYKEGINFEFLQQYCIENGEMRIFKHGELFEHLGESSHRIGYIEKGCFKYIVHNEKEGKGYITGFAFADEFVGDYPNCLYGLTSEVMIKASMASKVYIVEGAEIYRMFNENIKSLQYGMKIMEGLFRQIYSNHLNFYRLDARGRYEHLLNRCPQVVQQLSLKDISSYLKLHPNTISKIRHDITFSEQ